MSKKFICFLMSFSLLLTVGCATQNQQEINKPIYYSFADDLGNKIDLSEKPEKVVSLLGSYSEMWLLAGGNLIATTEDAVSERNLEFPNEVEIIGTVKDPNIELILSIKPDFVIMSTDVPSHVKLADTLKQANIPFGYFKEDSVSDYLRVLKIFTDITNREDLYVQYGREVENAINTVLSSIPENRENPKILLIRSMSTKAKALKDDHMVGKMLLDLKTNNIATTHSSLLEDLSMETIIAENPDFIFVVTMGNVDKAIQTLENGIMSNPAWKNLDAVKNKHFYILPKDLFQYKPNARYGESYEYLKKIIYE